MNPMRPLKTIVMIVLVGLVLTATAVAMVPEDIFSMRQVAVGDVSPDGRFMFYSLTAWDDEAASRSTTIYRRDLASGEDLLIFTPEDRAGGPVWGPDGRKVAYRRRTDEGGEIWLMAGDGAERRRLGSAPGADVLQWSPDGETVAWIAGAQVGSYDGKPGERVVADDLGYRHLNAGYREGELAQLFIMDLDDGRPRQLVAEPLDVRDLAWSPDGKRIAFAAKARPDLGWNLNTDLWLVDRSGGEPVQLTTNPGPDQDPRWLDDGSLAWLRATDPLWESGPRTISVMDPDRGDAALLSHYGYDNFFWRWETDGEAIYILGTRRGTIDLVRLDDAGPVHLTDGGHDFWSLHLAGGKAVMAGAGQSLPSAIFTLELAGRDQVPMTVVDPNRDWLRRVGLIEPEPFTVEVDGSTVEGWFFKPPDLHPGDRVPLVLSIHGGPEWMYGGYFLPEFHVLPRFGYGVVICNPVGSTGYGFPFQEAVRGDWMGRPAHEVMAAVDLAIKQGWADADRLAVMGGSYGGHLAAGLTTQTNRFRAAAVDRMFPEPVAFWGTTDEKWFPEWEWMGRPWEAGAREIYAANSPFEAVSQVTTPTLISHGMRDYRCLVAGGEIWFSALQALGVPSRFIRFENEGHGIRGPANQVWYLNQLLAWFEQYVLEGDSLE
ncbi:hypothetical protein DRQ50_04535 [bacterium]|nr:MAG: hypothetical protein DRQ50_04535 [bacterium]